MTQCNKYISKLLLENRLSIDEVIITGNKFTERSSILNHVDGRQPILYVDLSELARKIKSTNKWVKDIRIYRILPNILHIDIGEYDPFAIWMDGNHSSVIDPEGNVVIDWPCCNESSLRKNLVVISGHNALLNLEFVKSVMKRKTQLSEQISSFVFIGKRRWDIILNNGLTIKLPEDNPNRALDLLQGIELSEWSIIDMRVIDKIFVKR